MQACLQLPRRNSICGRSPNYAEAESNAYAEAESNANLPQNDCRTVLQLSSQLDDSDAGAAALDVLVGE